MTHDTNTKMIVQYPKKCCEKISSTTPPIKTPHNPIKDMDVKMLIRTTTIRTIGITNPCMGKCARRDVCKRARIKKKGIRKNACCIRYYSLCIINNKPAFLTSKNNESSACWNDFSLLTFISVTSPISKFSGKTPPKLAETTISPNTTVLS